MSRRLLAATGAGAAVVLVALLGTALGWWSSGTAQATSGAPLAVSTSLTPSSTFFADPVVARVVVAYDAKQVDASTLTVQPDFSPYVVTGPPSVRRTHDGGVAAVTYSYSLQCETNGCLPVSGPATVRFRPVVATAGAGAKRRTASGAWPALSISSRLQRSDLAASPPFRHPAASPPVVYGVAPGALADGLTVGAGLLGAIALALGGLELKGLVARRRAGAAPGRLEAAVALVRQAAGREDAADRRKALELLSEALAHEGRPALADSAGDAAWAASAPSPGQAIALADEVEAAVAATGDGEGGVA